MRIDRLTLTNFGPFASQVIDFDPHFTLLVGDNASGKSCVLDALSIALGSWFIGMRDLITQRGIRADEVHRKQILNPDGWTFESQFPCEVRARGFVSGEALEWSRDIAARGGRTSSKNAVSISSRAQQMERQVASGDPVVLPLICTYGTERLWFERSKSSKKPQKRTYPSRLDGYRDCIDFEIQESSLLDWIQRESSAGHNRGMETAALRLVTQAITECVDHAVSMYYDERYQDVVVQLEHGYELFHTMSDGQRIMLTMVGDLARRACSLNPQLGERVLLETPGVVIVDELDLHLHPNWQRRVMKDLRTTFPLVQFIASTHSPQLIGEAETGQVRRLLPEGVFTPHAGFGLDSNSVLEDLMGARVRNRKVEEEIAAVHKLIDGGELHAAAQAIGQLEKTLGSDDAELTRAKALIQFLELPSV